LVLAVRVHEVGALRGSGAGHPYPAVQRGVELHRIESVPDGLRAVPPGRGAALVCILDLQDRLMRGGKRGIERAAGAVLEALA
jgi:hypothetical protein